jgi:hypothetical protein
MKATSKIAKTVRALCAVCLGLSWSATAQSTIAYFNGPPFAIPGESEIATIDFDQDGTADFSFAGGLFICTTDVPSSGCSASFYAGTLGTNNLLCLGGQLVIVPFGTILGSGTSTNTAWRTVDGAVMATYFMSPRYGTSGWGGPLHTPGTGFFGVRFNAGDGLHYGWVRARMSNPTTNNLEFAPVILDWAYETRVNMPIAAGALPVIGMSPPRIVRPGKLRLEWQAQVGEAYQLQFKDQLEATYWTNLDFSVIATTTNITVEVPATSSTKFFRAVVTQ